MKKSGKASLAERISGILQTTPQSFDPEDHLEDDTTARLVDDHDADNQVDDDDDDAEERILSRFRKENVDLLADVDARYAGRTGTRKSLKPFDDDDDDDEDDIESDTNDVGADDSDVVDEQDESIAEEEESEDSSSLDDDDDDDDNDILSAEEDDGGSFKHISDTNISSQVKKGMCVRNQMSLWESLLETRIQLQKCLITANKMPQSSHFKQIKKESANSGFTQKVSETKQTLSKVLDGMLLLQKLLTKQYPETKDLEKNLNESEGKRSSGVNSDDDEEIPSDTEDEEKPEEIEECRLMKKRKLNDYESEIKENHEKYRNYRNDVIQKWNDKTRISSASKGANIASYSVLNQIEHNLSNKDRLIKRTQQIRSKYDILGASSASATAADDDKNDDIEYHSEIFDDDDFYHQLLRELIEVKSADLTDPVQLGRQWIQLQNLRSKMKRKIDTKATKGRRIRYAVHTKLVNFMAPIDRNLWTDEAKTELFSSLFGKNQVQIVPETTTTLSAV